MLGYKRGAPTCKPRNSAHKAGPTAGPSGTSRVIAGDPTGGRRELNDPNCSTSRASSDGTIRKARPLPGSACDSTSSAAAPAPAARQVARAAVGAEGRGERGHEPRRDARRRRHCPGRRRTSRRCTRRRCSCHGGRRSPAGHCCNCGRRRRRLGAEAGRRERSPSTSPSILPSVLRNGHTCPLCGQGCNILPEFCLPTRSRKSAVATATGARRHRSLPLPLLLVCTRGILGCASKSAKTLTLAATSFPLAFAPATTHGKTLRIVDHRGETRVTLARGGDPCWPCAAETAATHRSRLFALRAISPPTSQRGGRRFRSVQGRGGRARRRLGASGLLPLRLLEGAVLVLKAHVQRLHRRAKLAPRRRTPQYCLDGLRRATDFARELPLLVYLNTLMHPAREAADDNVLGHRGRANAHGEGQEA
mmetsp:Transcript_125420/g.401661  ORF Transcript_125420/g.401661 Transcript_125420/m.401661 type:complete len:420 (+) Transcript_125420:6-1265(+)